MTAGASAATAAAAPALVALDWGTTSLRAFLMAADGQVLATRASGHGIRHLPAAGVAGFEQALTAIAGDWLTGAEPGLPIVACGMVGSASGWREAPYVACPTRLDALAAQACRVDRPGAAPLWIAPGVKWQAGARSESAAGTDSDTDTDTEAAAPDVMRGEETQIAGALALHPAWAALPTGLRLVLPGTHSKWARVQQGELRSFSTWMTGELFAVLRGHSILGQLLPADDAPTLAATAIDAALDHDIPATATTLAASEAAHVGGFRRGVLAAARSGGRDLTHQLFGTRTLGLLGGLSGPALAGYLSGLLIGHELVCATRSDDTGTGNNDSTQDNDNAATSAALPVVLIGAPALCARYDLALRLLGQPALASLDNTAPAGLWRFASAAGLLPQPH